MWLHLFGRLKPGVSFAEAEARANGVLQANLIAFYGAAATGERRAEFLDQRLQITEASRGASYKRAELSGSLTALLVGVGILLLIACANLANLLLARGAARRAEMTLRLSLGAGRGRLMRQLVTESLVLAAAGGVAAAAVAAAMHRGLVVMLAEADPAFALSFNFDAPIAVFLVGCTFTAALLFGLLPAWQATATDASSALKEQGRGAIGSRMRGRSGRVLVGVQLALSLPLLVGAGLLARTAYNVQRIDLGVNVDNLLLARVDLRATIDDPARRDAMRQALLERIRQAPGVRSATFSQLGLFSAAFSTRNIQVEGYTPQAGRDPETNVGCRWLRLLRDARHAAGPGTRHPGQRHARSAEGLRRQRIVREPVLRPPQSDRSPGHGHRQRRAADPAPRRRRGQRCAYAIAEGSR